MYRTGVTLDKDQVKNNMARERAMKENGYKFITLRLLDYTKNRIQGAHCLHPIPWTDPNGMPKFNFEVRGMPLKFELDELQGAMFANMLDCDHNRRFLASMSPYHFWEIEDKQVEAEIMEIAKEMTKKSIIEKPAVKVEEKPVEQPEAAPVTEAEAIERVLADQPEEKQPRKRGVPAKRRKLVSVE